MMIPSVRNAANSACVNGLSLEYELVNCLTPPNCPICIDSTRRYLFLPNFAKSDAWIYKVPECRDGCIHLRVLQICQPFNKIESECQRKKLEDDHKGDRSGNGIQTSDLGLRAE
jgi:hypothetical protein